MMSYACNHYDANDAQSMQGSYQQYLAARELKKQLCGAQCEFEHVGFRQESATFISSYA